MCSWKGSRIANAAGGFGPCGTPRCTGEVQAGTAKSGRTPSADPNVEVRVGIPQSLVERFGVDELRAMMRQHVLAKAKPGRRR